MSETTRIRALCCECGNLRTVAANYNPPRDANRTGECEPDKGGWRVTGTLKCWICATNTRHALLRDHDDYRDFAELSEHQRHAVIRQRPAENANTPSYRIIDRMRNPEAVGAGRHPGASRTLTAIDASGHEIATAFEYPDYWQIDVEHHTIKTAGLDPLVTNIIHGFGVRSGDEAYDWLRLFGELAGKTSQQSQGKKQ
jgi:hypothetical protein